MTTKNPPSLDADKKASLTLPVGLEVPQMGIPLNMDVASGEGMSMESLLNRLQAPAATSSHYVAQHQPKDNAGLGAHHATDDDDVFTSICNKRLVTEFAELQQHKLSTSTPSGVRTLSSGSITSEAALHDSGFNELTWSTTFAETCSISTTVDRMHHHCHSATFESPSAVHQEDDPLLSMPMPKMLLKFSDCDPDHDHDDPMDYKHEDKSHDVDSAFGDCSSSCSSHHHHSQCFSDLSQHSSIHDHHHSKALDFDDELAALPTPSIVRARHISMTTPAQSRHIYSSTPLTVVEKIVEKFSPAVPSRLIGRNMGLETMDIVTELSFLDLSEPLSMIMDHLEDDDVCRMCCVSRRWKSACENNHAAREKRQRFADRRQALERELQKENMHLKGARKKLTGGSEVPLAVVQDMVEKKAPRTPLPLPTNYQQFVQEAGRLKTDESLCKCPSCGKPARVHQTQERGQCTDRKCALDFCIKCNNHFHGSRECSRAAKKSRTDSTVGTKKSKKNLRRLL